VLDEATISTSGTRWGGLKGCPTMSRPGSFIPEAIADAGMLEDDGEDRCAGAADSTALAAV
jgi:hypothetical protein